MEEILQILIWIIIDSFLWYFIRIKGKSKTHIDVKGNSVDRIIKNSEELISTNITKLKKTAQRTIGKSHLIGCSWLLINDNSSDKIIYTFRNNY